MMKLGQWLWKMVQWNAKTVRDYDKRCISAETGRMFMKNGAMECRIWDSDFGKWCIRVPKNNRAPKLGQ